MDRPEDASGKSIETSDYLKYHQYSPEAAVGYKIVVVFERLIETLGIDRSPLD